MKNWTASLLVLLCSVANAAAATAANATELLEQMRARYASLKSYSDTGVIITEENGGSPTTFKEHHTFTTYFRAPKQFFFDFRAEPTGSGDRFVLWIDGAEVNTWWQTTGVHDKYPQGQGATGFAIGSLPTKGSIAIIASLIFPGLQDVTALQEPRLLPAEAVDGHRCYKVIGIYAPAYGNGVVTASSPVTLWIDAETLLIRKIFSDTSRESPPSVIDRSTVIFTPRANPDVQATVFRFTVPSPK